MLFIGKYHCVMKDIFFKNSLLNELAGKRRKIGDIKKMIDNPQHFPSDNRAPQQGIGNVNDVPTERETSQIANSTTNKNVAFRKSLMNLEGDFKKYSLNREAKGADKDVISVLLKQFRSIMGCYYIATYLLEFRHGAYVDNSFSKQCFKKAINCFAEAEFLGFESNRIDSYTEWDLTQAVMSKTGPDYDAECEKLLASGDLYDKWSYICEAFIQLKDSKVWANSFYDSDKGRGERRYVQFTDPKTRDVKTVVADVRVSSHAAETGTWNADFASENGYGLGEVNNDYSKAINVTKGLTCINIVYGLGYNNFVTGNEVNGFEIFISYDMDMDGIAKFLSRAGFASFIKDSGTQAQHGHLGDRTEVGQMPSILRMLNFAVQNSVDDYYTRGGQQPALLSLEEISKGITDINKPYKWYPCLMDKYGVYHFIKRDYVRVWSYLLDMLLNFDKVQEWLDFLCVNSLEMARNGNLQMIHYSDDRRKSSVIAELPIGLLIIRDESALRNVKGNVRRDTFKDDNDRAVYEANFKVHEICSLSDFWDCINEIQAMLGNELTTLSGDSSSDKKIGFVVGRKTENSYSMDALADEHNHDVDEQGNKTLKQIGNRNVAMRVASDYQDGSSSLDDIKGKNISHDDSSKGYLLLHHFDDDDKSGKVDNAVSVWNSDGTFTPLDYRHMYEAMNRFRKSLNEAAIGSESSDAGSFWHAENITEDNSGKQPEKRRQIKAISYRKNYPQESVYNQTMKLSLLPQELDYINGKLKAAGLSELVEGENWTPSEEVKKLVSVLRISNHRLKDDRNTVINVHVEQPEDELVKESLIRRCMLGD